MKQRVSTPVFVGRREELAHLAAAYEAAAAGRPSLVLVAGEAGVGKSRLLVEFGTGVSASGGRTLVGGCLDLDEGGLPLAPFTEALKALVRTLRGASGTAGLEDLFGSSAWALGGLVPEIRQAVAASDRTGETADEGGRQARLFDAFLELLGRLAAASPVVLLLEDLHWADGSTRDLLRFLLRNLREERLLMVATFRSDDLHRRHPLKRLLPELERSSRVQRLDLRPFDHDEIREQAAAILGYKPAAAIIDRIVARSDGLPFYVEELLATDSAGGVVSESLRDVVGLTLASVPDAAVSLVRTAAVIGGRFTLDRLAAVTQTDQATLLPALRGAMDARVIVLADDHGQPRYAFRHALLREAAYEDLLPAERTLLHARLAEHLTQELATGVAVDPGLLADVAIHAYRAGDQPRALTTAVRAVSALADAGAVREALDHAHRALELWPRVASAEVTAGVSQGDLLAIAGRVAADSGVMGPALAHTTAALQELEPSASAKRLAELLMDIYNAAFGAEAFDTAWATARRLHSLVDRIEPSRLRVHALIVVGDERWSTGHVRESLELSEQALVLARALGDDGVWAVVAFEAAAGLATAGRAGRAEALVDAAAALPTGFDGSVRPFMAAVAGCWALWHAGRFEESARLASAAHAAAIRYGVDRRHGPWFTANQAHAMFELGHLEEAEKLARSLDEHRYVGMWTVIAKMEAVRGSFEAARAAMRTDDLWNSPLWRLETAVFIDRAAGDFAGVRAHMQAAEAELRASEVVSPVWLTLGSAIGAAADHASAARRRRQHAEAEAAVSLGGRWLEQLREIVDDGRANGGAGRFREATLAMAESEMQRVTTGSDPMTWADVVERWCALAHPHGTASAELRHAESLLMGNQNQAAAAVLPRRAHATATTLGAVPLRGAIETMARHARIDLAPAPGTDPGRPPGGEPTPDGRSR